MSSYIFRRKDSQFWQVRFQDKTTGKNVVRSLKVTDKTQAEILAAPLSAEHKSQLLAKRMRFVPVSSGLVQSRGLCTAEDGRRFFIDAHSINELDETGAVIRSVPNAGRDLVNATYPVVFTNGTLVDRKKFPGKVIDLSANLVSVNTADDDLIETYIKHNKFADDGQPARETRQVWAMFKTLTNNKRLAKCTRDDGRMLAEKYRELGDKSATRKKKISRVCAAVNLAIAEGKLTFNPFSGVTQLEDDATKILPLDDAEMAKCFANINASGEERRQLKTWLSKDDALLFRLLAATGMRPGEPFQINGEHVEKGIRYVIVGTKTKQSKRRVPLPASVLPYLPAKIDGPLFTDRVATLPRLNKWLTKLGIKKRGNGKVTYSLRHRAQDVMRAEGCPVEIREELFGREKVTVAAGYGRGHPVTVLKEWIDKVCPLPAPEIVSNAA